MSIQLYVLALAYFAPSASAINFVDIILGDSPTAKTDDQQDLKCSDAITDYNSDERPYFQFEMWPNKWEDATAHGRWIAHRLDNATLFKVLYAETDIFEGQTVDIKEYKVPSLKMASAIPGYRPLDAATAKQVTVFPTYLALASTWDPYMVMEVATAVSEEFLTLGANTMLGPAINVHRATQHGDNFDSLSGEDPILGSIMTKAWCLTVHHHGIITVPKFLGRTEQVPVHVGDRSANETAWEIFYPPFQAAIDSGSAGVMCDAHEVDGIWACRDTNVLNRDLKGIMGFQGMVVANRGAAMNYFPSDQPSSFERGLDMAFDEPTTIPPTERGVMAMTRSVERVLAAIWHMRVTPENSCELPCTQQHKRIARTEKHSEVAKTAAASAVVMLKNDGDLLPLTRDKVKTVALMGPAAAELPMLQPGNGAEGDYYTGLKEEHINGAVFFSPAFGLWSRGKAKGITVTDNVTGADVCVVIGGSKKNIDHWKLDDESLSAIDDAVNRCPKVVVLMEIMGAVLLPFRNEVQAMLSVFHAGEETAAAWATTVFGDASPSGKLPISFPLIGQRDAEYWNEPIPSYMSKSFQATYWFGHGLSYARFLYQDMKEKPRCRYNLCLAATVLNVHPTNSGSEVVQVYFKYNQRPDHPMVLKGFYKTKVLKPGQTEKAFFIFDHRDISIYTDLGKDGQTLKEETWVPQNEITVFFGSSSNDIRGQFVVYPRHA